MEEYSLSQCGLEQVGPLFRSHSIRGGSDAKQPPATWETRVQSLGGEDPLEKEMANHSSILAWGILWTEDPGRLLGVPENQT